MIDFLKKCGTTAFAIVGMIFTFGLESIVGMLKIFDCIKNDNVKILVIRITVYIVVFLLFSIGNWIYLKIRNKVVIKGHNYSIQVQYGDIFQLLNCKKVITFDECFTTEIGDAPHQIKPTSICGQYLKMNPTLDINALISASGITSKSTPSKYNSKTRYESGTIVHNGEFLLMAFAKLDSNGLGHLSRDEYLDCLSRMWKAINKYYAQNNVCISILGSGITRTGSGSNITQQELLDLIINSYKLCNNKIKNPNKLIIVCRKDDDFSINNTIR